MSEQQWMDSISKTLADLKENQLKKEDVANQVRAVVNDALEKKVTKRFDKIDKRQDKMEERLEKLEKDKEFASSMAGNNTSAEYLLSLIHI